MSEGYIQIPIALEMDDMDSAQLAQVLIMAPLVENFFKAAKAEAKARLNKGDKVPGWHMAPGNRSRAWKNDQAAMDGMAAVGINDPYERKLRTVPAVEKTLTDAQKERMREYWDWHPGTPVMKQTAGSKAAVAPTSIFDNASKIMDKPKSPDW